jgi:hypothetical protein
MMPLTPARIGDIQVHIPSRAISVPRFGLGHHETNDPRLLGVTARLRETRKALRHECRELIESNGIDALAAAE